MSKLVKINRTAENAALEHHLRRQGWIPSNDAVVHVKDEIIFPKAYTSEVFGAIGSGRPSWFLTRFFSRRNGWSSQCFVGVILHGIQDGGLGASYPCGSLGGYVELLNESLNKIDLSKTESVFKDLDYNGPVSLIFDDTDSVLSFQTGVPSYGLYALCEGLKQDIPTIWSEEGVWFLESWVCSLLVSRWPFPNVGTGITSVHVSPSVEKHLWLFPEGAMFKEQYNTSSGRIGVVTSWSNSSLYDCNLRATGTAHRLQFEEKQFRTDGFDVARMVFGRLLDKGWFRFLLPFPHVVDRVARDLQGSNLLTRTESIQENV